MRAETFLPSPTRPARRPEREPRNGVLVALDSDGTVLDSMRPKHETCFAPAFVERFAEGANAEVLFEVWRFVNLESRFRGVNRYRALAQALGLLPSHPGAGKPREFWSRTAFALEAWIVAEASPSRDRLARGAREGGCLAEVLAWSEAVDAAIAALPPPPPFAGARQALPGLAAAAEILVLTAAPEEAVREEWRQAGILGFAAAVAGQERGPKSLSLAERCAGRFAPSRTLVVGDAPGDLEAARSCGAAFFPIVSGREEESWAAFAAGGLERALAGERAPAGGLLAEFLEALPAEPRWIRRC